VTRSRYSEQWERQWPVKPLVRPELVSLVARLEDFSSERAAMSAEQLADIIPAYLPSVPSEP
jgi:hypothetical protein